MEEYEEAVPPLTSDEEAKFKQKFPLAEDELQEQMQQIPIFMEGVPPKIVGYGLKFGIIKLGWTVQDYLRFAVQRMGYETVVGWGVQF